MLFRSSMNQATFFVNSLRENRKVRKSNSFDKLFLCLFIYFKAWQSVLINWEILQVKLGRFFNDKLSIFPIRPVSFVVKLGLI